MNNYIGYVVRESFRFPDGTLDSERDRRAGDKPHEIFVDGYYGSSTAHPYEPEAEIHLLDGIYSYRESVGETGTLSRKHRYVRVK